MQIKTTLALYLIRIRMSNINKTTDNKCWRGSGEKETSVTVGEIANWSSHSGNQCGESPKITQILHFDIHSKGHSQ